MAIGASPAQGGPALAPQAAGTQPRPGPPSYAQYPPPPQASHLGRNIGIAVLIVLLIVIALAVVPVPHTVPYSLTIDNPGSVSATYYATQALCPTGASATVSFSVLSGDSVTFSIVNPSGGTVWSDDASGGSTTFTVQNCGTYEFGAYDWVAETVTVSVSLSSTSPLL